VHSKLITRPCRLPNRLTLLDMSETNISKLPEGLGRLTALRQVHMDERDYGYSVCFQTLSQYTTI
jgi:hypothetical protein